jgi:hypothetical protein
MRKLLAAVSGRSCLLVLDDVRDGHQLCPLLGASDLTILITTRDAQVARRLGAEVIPVGCLENQAVQVLTWGVLAPSEAAALPAARNLEAAAIAGAANAEHEVAGEPRRARCWRRETPSLSNGACRRPGTQQCTGFALPISAFAVSRSHRRWSREAWHGGRV